MPVLRNVGDLYMVRSRKLQDCEEISAVNLIFFCTLLRFVRNVWSSSGVWGQIINTSSMYLFQRLGLLAWLFRKFSSRSPMYKVARAEANLVPIARPYSCVKVRLYTLHGQPDLNPNNINYPYLPTCVDEYPLTEPISTAPEIDPHEPYSTLSDIDNPNSLNEPSPIPPDTDNSNPLAVVSLFLNHLILTTLFPRTLSTYPTENSPNTHYHCYKGACPSTKPP